MGWRFRKSINLGGGFKINLSKSGVGYSWGIPGYRHTYSPNGTQRKTYSIPGTGLSYVKSQGKSKNKQEFNEDNYNYDKDSKLIKGNATYYQNSNISHMGKGDELLNQIKKLRIINLLANVCLILFVFFPIGVLLKLLIALKWKLDLTYEMDEINQKKYNALNDFLIELKKNKKIWQIDSSVEVYNSKYNAGANNNVSRNQISVVKRMPWYIKHNIDVYCLKLEKEKIYFTPDRMIIFKGISSVGCRKYNDMVASFSTTNFVETKIVPSDAEIVEYTWEYLNKSGNPDKRFKNNRKIPVCEYGELSLKTEDGINILLEYSNHRVMNSIQQKFTEFMKYHNQIISTKGYQDEYELEVNNSIEKYDEYEKDVIYEPINNNEKLNTFTIKTDKDNKNNISSNESVQEQEIENPIKEEKSLFNKEVRNDNNSVENITSKSKVLSILCYCQVACAGMMLMGCLLNTQIIGSVLWGLVALIFVPKIKEILCKRFSFLDKIIIPIRCILVIVALFSI